MSDFQIVLAASLVSACIAFVGLVVAARRSRTKGIDEPTDMLPLLSDFGDDPLERPFDEALRLLRGEVDEDFAALADRRRLHSYEADFQTIRFRRLTRRLARLDQT